MRKTIGKKWPASAPYGDVPARCSYCGVIWRRSQLAKDRSGNLSCPDDQRGRDIVTLSLANARAAQTRKVGSSPVDGMAMDREQPAVQVPGPSTGAWVPTVRSF